MMLATYDSLLRPGPAGVVADFSVVIGLSASLGFEIILRELPFRLLVPRGVMRELEAGRRKGHTIASDLETQLSAKRAEIVDPTESVSRIYTRLVSPEHGHGLDLGEAETIVCAVERNAVALIDENRARRICESEFSRLAVASSVDVFAHPRVIGLGKPKLASLVRNAVLRGRMHVVRCREWVDELVGIDTRSAGDADV